MFIFLDKSIDFWTIYLFLSPSGIRRPASEDDDDNNTHTSIAKYRLRGHIAFINKSVYKKNPGSLEPSKIRKNRPLLLYSPPFTIWAETLGYFFYLFG